MLKADELGNPNSCMNRARDDEDLFVLMGRDIAAPATIRFWCTQRVTLGKNEASDTQIREALACASRMEAGQGR